MFKTIKKLYNLVKIANGITVEDKGDEIHITVSKNTLVKMDGNLLLFSPDNLVVLKSKTLYLNPMGELKNKNKTDEMIKELTSDTKPLIKFSEKKK